MTGVLALALGVAGVNVGTGRWLARRAPGATLWQAAGFLFRFVVMFGTAQLVWMLRRRSAEVVVFILTAAISQLIGQVYFFLKKERTAGHA